MGWPKKRAKEYWYNLGQRRCYCGVQLVWNPHQKNSATFEHLVPRSHGGTFALQNSLIICRMCNQNRGNTCWITWIKKNNPPKAIWLLKKYEEALKFYEMQDRKIKIKKTSSAVNIYIHHMIINNSTVRS